MLQNAIFNLNGNVYHNQVNAFTIENLYPVPHTFSADKQTIFSGNVKLNNNFYLPENFGMQATAVWLAPDIIPQGKIDQRFSLDLRIKNPFR